jgi:hypothetical protein
MKSIFAVVLGLSLVAPLAAHAAPQANEFRQSYPSSTINSQIHDQNQINQQAQRASHQAVEQG